MFSSAACQAVALPKWQVMWTRPYRWRTLGKQFRLQRLLQILLRSQIPNPDLTWMISFPMPCPMKPGCQRMNLMLERKARLGLTQKQKYPPTPAFAKAGAAPGTTGGVDPVFLEPLPRPTLQAKDTTRPQQWLKSTPRPQQWLLF